MSGVVKQVVEALREAWRSHAALRDLNQLSDHHLADLGLRREQLPTLARRLEDEATPVVSRRLPDYRAELVPCG